MTTYYGMQVNNTSDVNIIGLYKNYIYHDHGTSFVEEGTTIIPISPFASHGLIFFKPTDFYVNPYGFEMDEADFAAIQIASDSTGYVDWAIFKEIENTDVPSSADYGLEIYNSDDELIFTTLTKGYINWVNRYPVPGTPPLTVNNTNNYFCLSQMSTKYDLNVLISGGTKTVTYNRKIYSVKKIDSTKLDFEWITYDYQQIVSSESGDSDESRSDTLGSYRSSILEIKTQLT